MVRPTDQKNLVFPLPGIKLLLCPMYFKLRQDMKLFSQIHLPVLILLIMLTKIISRLA